MTSGGESSVERVARFLIAALPATSFAGVLLLIFGSFTSERALVLGALVAFWLASRLRPRARMADRWPRKAAMLLLAVLVLAFLVRWPPALYLEGGQDEGVYVSMAGHFIETGSLGSEDKVRDRLRDIRGATARYDENNVVNGIFQPGVYASADPGEYVFQFYPVHPLWLAIFGGLFGSQNLAASQCFFGLISLLFAALLAERLSGRWRAGIAYAGLLAILPLHIFFSKFPISEMPALAFALMGWYAAIRASDGEDHRPSRAWLFAATLCFLALFLTRISGFVYLPVIVAGMILAHVFSGEPDVRARWLWFWTAVALGYCVSIAYGLVFSGPYSNGIYRMGLGRLYPYAPWLLAAFAIALMLAIIGTRGRDARAALRRLLDALWQRIERFGPALLLAILALGGIRVFLLAATDHYAGHFWYDSTWHSSHAGWRVVLQSSVVVAAEQLSPLVAILLPFALYRPGRSPARAMLVVMVFAMIAYTAWLQWFTPYQYYYARYLLSEVAPYTLLLVVLRAFDWASQPRARSALAAAAFAAVAYFSWLAWPLIGFAEAHGAYASLARIADRTDRNDVLLFEADTLENPHQVVTPLRFFFGRTVYVVRNPTEIDAIIRDLVEIGAADIYLITANKPPHAFRLVDRIAFEQQTMAWQLTVPRTARDMRYRLPFYALDRETWNADTLTGTGLTLSQLGADCCTGIYIDQTWTAGDATVRGLRLPAGDWRTLIIKVHGYRPNYANAHLQVFIGSRELPMARQGSRQFAFALGRIEGPASLDIRIRSDAFVPKDAGINDDTRELGIDIAGLQVR